jgi:hypothetical protein
MVWDIDEQGGYVYYTDYTGDTVNRILSGGGGSRETLVASPNTDAPYGVVSDGTYVYWVEDKNPGAVKKKLLSGGAVVTLASGLNGPYKLVQDANFLYWTEPASGRVMKVAK